MIERMTMAFLRRLYRDALPFRLEHQRRVKGVGREVPRPVGASPAAD